MAVGVIGNDNTNKLLNKNNENKYYDDTFEINFDDENECHAIICRNINKGSTVLDVGCAQGLIGKALKKIDCKVYGIDINEDAINQAKKTNSYEQLFLLNIRDIESIEYQEFINNNIKFDYIIFSDVLEHLEFPARTLYSLGHKLNKNGKVLVSLPNIAHYDIINGLLNEKFNYSLMGLLDNTHLRFFTKYSFAEYIMDANKYENFYFDCEVIGKTVIPPYFVGTYPELDNIINDNPDLLILQNIFCLTKVDKLEDTKKLQAIINEKAPNLSEKINYKLEDGNKYKKDFDDLKQKYDALLNDFTNEKNQKEAISNELALEKEKNKEVLNNLEIEKNKNESISHNLELEKENSISILNKYNNLENKYINLENNYINLEYDHKKILYSRTYKYTSFIRKINAKYKEYKLKHQLTQISKKSILYIIHSWINLYDRNLTNIGGTSLHLLDLISNMQKDYNVFVLTVINDKYMLVCFYEGHQYIYDLKLRVSVKNFDAYDYNFYTLIKELINNLNIDLVHIHHIINFPCDLQFIPSFCKTVFTVHDYAILCPKYFLIDYNDRYCNKHDDTKCLKCFCPKIDYNTRNNAVKNLLLKSSKIIVPDESIINEIQKYYDINNYSVIPHGIDKDSFYEFKHCKHNTNKIKNIAFVGVIDRHKGLNYIKNIIGNDKNPNHIYHLFGDCFDEYLKSNKCNYIYHGVYDKRELPRILNDNNIDLVLLLSTCPETFSYILSEVMLAGIPSLSFNLGAIGNRIKKYGVGWVLDGENITYEDILNKYDEVFDKKKLSEGYSKFKKI